MMLSRHLRHGNIQHCEIAKTIINILARANSLIPILKTVKDIMDGFRAVNSYQLSQGALTYLRAPFALTVGAYGFLNHQIRWLRT